MRGMAEFATVQDVDLDVNRHVAFSEELRFVGVDWSGATFAAHIRDPRDVAGTPWLSFTFDTPVLTEEDGLDVTTVNMEATKAAVDNIPYDIERGEDLPAPWDLLVDPAGGSAQFRFCQGTANIKAGATIP